VQRSVSDLRVHLPGDLPDHLFARVPAQGQRALVRVREAPSQIERDERVGDARQDRRDVARAASASCRTLRLHARRLGARQQVLRSCSSAQPDGDVLQDADEG
jgi:hypothetical protein